MHEKESTPLATSAGSESGRLGRGERTNNQDSRRKGQTHGNTLRVPSSPAPQAPSLVTPTMSSKKERNTENVRNEDEHTASLLRPRPSEIT